MDWNETSFSERIRCYNPEACRMLSRKPNSGVYLIKKQDAEPFVLRIYSRQMPVYEAIRNQKACGGLPRIYDCRREAELYIVEEQWIDGISLQEMLDGGQKMEEPRALRIIAETAAAVIRLHEAGFIHRDIKAEHVMLDTEGRIFLIDLDAAMEIKPHKTNDTRMLGTAGYAAPEQFGLSRSDVRTDIYAMGILLNMLLTGAHPAVTRYRGGRAEEIIRTCTEINPQDRYQTMYAFAEAVRGAQAEAEAKRADSRFSRQKLWGRHRKTAAAAVMILCLAGAAGIGLFTQSSEPAGQEERPTAGLTQAGTGAADSENENGEKEPKLAENGELQLHMDYLEGPVFCYNSCGGGKCLPLITEDNVLVGSDWDVYADEGIGRITGWEEEWLGWRLDSHDMMPGTEGFVHAKKDGKTYAMRILVTGEPISAYTKFPSFADMAEGYVVPTQEGGEGEKYARCTYHPGKKTTLYLAVAPTFEDAEPVCHDDRVTIKKCTEQGDWPHDGIYQLTFDNPKGGDAALQIMHRYGRLSVKFTEA